MRRHISGSTSGERRVVSEKRANARIRFLVLAFALVFTVALGRAAWVQIVEGGRYERMASRQHRETIEIPAGRGTIYDRTGEPLAIGELATTVYADPRNVVAPRRAAVKVADALGLDADKLYPSLRDRTKRFVFLDRKADPARAKALERLGVAGIGFYPEERRSYPQGRVAAHVLGYAGTDNAGLDGLERSLDKSLAGKPGYEIVVRDPSGRAIDVVRSRRERAGRNVVLTLDHQLQASAEQVLANAVARWGARGATAIVMDPRTGAILAMANAPTFDANAFTSAPAEARRNRAVTDLYEPGSTFKIVTVAAALEDNVVAPDTTFRLAPTIDVADRTIREAHTRGTESMTVGRSSPSPPTSGRSRSRRSSEAPGSPRGSTASGSASVPARTSQVRALGWCSRTRTGRVRQSAPCPSDRASLSLRSRW